MASKNLSGYPQPIGNRLECVTVHTGPAAYVQVTPGTPVVGGDTLAASEAGLKGIDWCAPGMSDDGQYIVTPIFSNNVPSPQNGTQASVKLLWTVAATGVEVAGGVNLSARTVRFMVQGL